MISVLVGLAAAALAASTARPPAKVTGRGQAPLLPREEWVRIFAAGHLNSAADVVWLQLIQQVGAAAQPEEYKWVLPYAQLSTRLDPDQVTVFRTAALTIPQNVGREVWVNCDEGRTIALAGLERFPHDPYLLQALAHIYLYCDRDYRKAADTLKLLGQTPGAPDYISQLATRLYAQAGDFDEGLELAQTLMESAGDPSAKAFFEKRVQEILLERELQRVDAAVMQYWRRENKPPARLEDLMPTDLSPPPVDPLGGSVYLDDYSRARSTSSKFRMELYEDATKKTAPSLEAEPEPAP